MADSTFDLTELQSAMAYAEFGKAVIKLAQDMEIVPKRQKVKRVVVEKEVVKYRDLHSKPGRKAKAAPAEAAVEEPTRPEGTE